jgi:hypothetical protein
MGQDQVALTRPAARAGCGCWRADQTGIDPVDRLAAGSDPFDRRGRRADTVKLASSYGGRALPQLAEGSEIEAFRIGVRGVRASRNLRERASVSV